MTMRGFELRGSASRSGRARARRSVGLWSVVLALIATLLLQTTATASGSAPRIWNTGWLSGNWAGYIVDNGPYTSVTRQWTVPSGSASSTGFSAVWLGVDGVSNHSLIQVGTEQDYYWGRARYSVWWEILPAPAIEITSFRVRPGDHITASIRRVATNRWRISISAAGRGSFTTTRTYAGRGTSAEWIVEAPVVNSWQSRLARHAPVVFD